MDSINIDGLKIFARHGVYPQEEADGQDFVLSARLFLSLQEAGLSDGLDMSISYEDVCLFLTEEFPKKRRRLIEAAAEDMSCALFHRYDMLKELELTVAKPDAPIAADVGSVSVTIHRKRHIAYVAYGANKGKPLEQIKKGIELLGQDAHCLGLRATQPLLSRPYGEVEQALFYNGMLELKTLYEPDMLLRHLQAVEAACGLNRSKKEHWGPRELDLDIILYDELILHTEELTIPHAEMTKRDFVLKPLCELNPRILHPIYKKSAGELAAALSKSYIVNEPAPADVTKDH